MNAWLGQQEHRHKVVIYQCDQSEDDDGAAGHRGMTKWTSLCLRQADLIFDLALGTSEESARQPTEVI